ncbi:hypothetical protein N483_16295 [Pseudoalteromonas luteoviolacea NCIMB 1944]|nr:hypothetical protein N483_16295 [Pseudoalteromonas luteoviolacea NCIMB 1944]
MPAVKSTELDRFYKKPNRYTKGFFIRYFVSQTKFINKLLK